MARKVSYPPANVYAPRPLDMRNPANRGGFDPSKNRAEVQPKRHAFDKPSPFGPEAPRQDHQAPVPGVRK